MFAFRSFNQRTNEETRFMKVVRILVLSVERVWVVRERTSGYRGTFLLPTRVFWSDAVLWLQNLVHNNTLY